MTAHFIVIGNPIAHSQSPLIHQKFAEQVNLDISYQRQFCPNDNESFQAVVSAFFNGGGLGANVTVPFKQMAYQLCENRLTEQAKIAKSVNTLFLQHGQICGDNTDGNGLVQHLQQLNWHLDGKTIAIIGAGGATRGILLPLLLAGVESVHIANRTVSNAQILVEDFHKNINKLGYTEFDLAMQDKLTYGSIKNLTGHYDLIINATSIGLSDEKLPLDDKLNCNYAYDMMYGCELKFLQHFAKKGAIVSNGFGMLVGQAMLSFQRWTNTEVNLKKLDFS